IINHFLCQMVWTSGIGIHTRATTDRVQARQNFKRLSRILRHVIRFPFLCSPIETVRAAESSPQNHPSRDCHWPQSSAWLGDEQHYNSAVLHDNPKLHRLVAAAPAFCLHLVRLARLKPPAAQDLNHPGTSSDGPVRAAHHQTIRGTAAMVAWPD